MNCFFAASISLATTRRYHEDGDGEDGGAPKRRTFISYGRERAMQFRGSVSAQILFLILPGSRGCSTSRWESTIESRASP
mmetsp:Transcript_7197/g.9345  ORF Transcript_7197/g.9345 Transcript_7197/m.9345 type:complete len:80 (-) Transcript_7197:201-440(-)